MIEKKRKSDEGENLEHNEQQTIGGMKKKEKKTLTAQQCILQM